MYTETNYRTKKAMLTALANGETVRVFQPGGIFPGTANGIDCIEGPHYPKPHKWYARVLIKDYCIVRLAKKGE